MNLTFEGNTAFIKKLKKLPEDTYQIMEEEIAVTMDEIYNRSQLAAPTDTGGGGGIRSSAYKDVRGLNGEVGYTSKYAPYHEFGTGALVDIPQGLEDYAMEFYVNGKGRIPANAFLFPAYFSETRDFMERVSNQLTKTWNN